jgi:hypothetical protein
VSREGAGRTARRATSSAVRSALGRHGPRAAMTLGACACLLACTDPRARPAPPTVRIFVASGLRATSPGTIATSISATDIQGLDSIVASLRSTFPGLQGDSTYLLPDTTAQTTSVIWAVPGGVPTGTRIVLFATAYNLIGFAARDSAVLTVEP